jgi:hypothetical protein
LIVGYWTFDAEHMIPDVERLTLNGERWCAWEYVVDRYHTPIINGQRRFDTTHDSRCYNLIHASTSNLKYMSIQQQVQEKATKSVYTTTTSGTQAPFYTHPVNTMTTSNFQPMPATPEPPSHSLSSVLTSTPEFFPSLHGAHG